RYARTFLRPGADPNARSEIVGAPPPPPAPPGRQAPLKEVAEELLRTFAHALDMVGVPWPARLCLVGDAGHDAPLAFALAEILGIPCSSLPPPALRSGAGHPLPPQAWAVASAALARL
ncbi:MAG TPA: hypothetical protein VIG69_16140, partial [Candidatus Methylomirabilis sp.]